MIHHQNVHFLIFFFQCCERYISYSAAGEKSLLNLLKHQAAETVWLSAGLALRGTDVTVNLYGLYIKSWLPLCFGWVMVGSLRSALWY